MKGRNYEKVEKVNNNERFVKYLHFIFVSVVISTMFNQSTEYRPMEMLFKLCSGYQKHLTDVQVGYFLKFSKDDDR